MNCGQYITQLQKPNLTNAGLSRKQPYLDDGFGIPDVSGHFRNKSAK